MNDAVISAYGLRKAFGDLVAVDGIDFDVRRGEAFGVLGPNGAGKTSPMRMIGCVSPPSGGGLDMFGLDPRRDGRAIHCSTSVGPKPVDAPPNCSTSCNWENEPTRPSNFSAARNAAPASPAR